ncbi:MAG: hypothetical protein RL277_2150 [Planctomycetota bacterium]
MTRLRWGCSSWSEPGWVGPFYPPGTKPGAFLLHYATQFDTVEADTTYYHAPGTKLVDGWAQKTPAGFTLSAKFPRSIVHGGEGREPDAERVLNPATALPEAQRFIDTMARMGDKLGPLVLQFPYFNQRAFASRDAFQARLEPFLDALPIGPRYAVEVRNKQWIGAPLLEALRARRVALVLLDLVYMPHPDEWLGKLDLVTADFLYLRLIGDRAAVEARTERFDAIVLDQSARLERWAELLLTLSPKVREVYSYANNHYAGHGPATIRDLRARVEARMEGAGDPG